MSQVKQKNNSKLDNNINDDGTRRMRKKGKRKDQWTDGHPPPEGHAKRPGFLQSASGPFLIVRKREGFCSRRRNRIRAN